MRKEPNIKDLNYQLGQYVGEFITRKYLPTLSTDALKTYNEIQVNLDDSIRHRHVSEALDKTRKYNGGTGDGKIEFAAYKALNNELARKYLKEKLHCQVPKIYPTDMDTFKEGLKDQLWNTDLSHYWPEDDFYEQGHELGWADYIILTLKISE